jgi:HAE1 family hydrophobic/amphiphilic exporter-1
VLLSVALVFDSVWSAGMILLSLPLAFTGVVAAFWISGATFTREAAVGVILVIGLSVNQAILLVDALLIARRRIGALSRRAVLRAARERAPMIVLVSTTALASLIPLSLGTDTSSLFGSMALATAGGTVAGLLGVVMVMPTLVAVAEARD